MKSVFAQLAMLFGLFLFAVALLIGWLRDVPILTSLIRASIVMILGAVAGGLFLRHFTGVVQRFVAEQVMQSRGRMPVQGRTPEQGGATQAQRQPAAAEAQK